MHYKKDVTVVTFDATEKPAYAQAVTDGLAALEAQIAALDAMCRWEDPNANVAALTPLREQRNNLITSRAKLHAVLSCLG